jgi:quinol monooxygenase YgiN
MAIMIVQGVYLVRPEDRERFIAESIGRMRSSRNEDGCLEYVLAADPLDPGRVVLSERWESGEHLERHLKGLSERGSEVDARPDPLGREFTTFEVASSQPMD